MASQRAFVGTTISVLKKTYTSSFNYCNKNDGSILNLKKYFQTQMIICMYMPVSEELLIFLVI